MNMIRLVELGKQIDEEKAMFAFFDTMTDTFLSFRGEQVFSDIEGFVGCACGSVYYERCVALIKGRLDNQIWRLYDV